MQLLREFIAKLKRSAPPSEALTLGIQADSHNPFDNRLTRHCYGCRLDKCLID